MNESTQDMVAAPGLGATRLLHFSIITCEVFHMTAWCGFIVTSPLFVFYVVTIHSFELWSAQIRCQDDNKSRTEGVLHKTKLINE
jgi:hypothetical protein